MNFDPVAPYYLLLERLFSFGQLQRARLAMLHELHDCKRILMVGEGQGRCLVPLLQRHPRAQVTCLDASPAMLERAAFKLQQSGLQNRCELIAADLLTWQPDEALTGSCDAVVSHFFFDCFIPPQQTVIIQKLTPLLSPSARWLLADFTPARPGLRGLPSRLLLALLYGFFQRAAGVGVRQVHPPDALLLQAGFALAQRRSLCLGLLHSDLWTR